MSLKNCKMKFSTSTHALAYCNNIAFEMTLIDTTYQISGII